MDVRTWRSVVRAIVKAQRADEGVTSSGTLRRGMPRGPVLALYEQRATALASALIAEGWTPPAQRTTTKETA
jgi:hypothetical protein